jgi:hypothetical protein
MLALPQIKTKQQTRRCILKFNEIVVATTTFYKSVEETRFKCAEKTIRNSKTHGSRIVIIDGSPVESVAEQLRNLGGEVYTQSAIAKTMGDARRELYRVIGGTLRGYEKYILWTEPEKYDLMHCIPGIITQLDMMSSREPGTQVDIVVPRRSAKSMESYPAFQRASETVGNRVYKETTSLDVDIFFGPVAFHRNMLNYFIDCKPQQWGAEDTYIQHYVPVLASKDGAIISSVEIDFEYPPEQKEEEENADLKKMVTKRNWQLASLVDGYYKLEKYLNG